MVSRALWALFFFFGFKKHIVDPFFFFGGAPIAPPWIRTEHNFSKDYLNNHSTIERRIMLEGKTSFILLSEGLSQDSNLHNRRVAGQKGPSMMTRYARSYSLQKGPSLEDSVE